MMGGLSHIIAKKMYIIVALFITIISAFSLNQNRDYIYQEGKKRYVLEWSKRKLDWVDFTFKPDTITKYKAETYTFKMNDDIENGNTDEYYKFLLRTCFIPNKSWTKDTLKSELLNHEQRHFDIAEVCTRKFKKQLSIYIIKSDSEFNSFYSKHLKRSKKHLDSMNTAYDSETNHGVISAKQKQWDKKIDDLLKKYEAYANDTVVVKRLKKP